MTQAAQKAHTRRKFVIRGRVSGSPERPRLTVFRSNKHIYAQVIDDNAGVTLAAVSSLTKALSGQIEKSESKVDQAKAVGEAIAKACLAKGIDKVVFDRNGYIYRGTDASNEKSKPTRVAAVAEAARAAGLNF